MRRASRQLFIFSPVHRAVLCLVSATGLGMLGAPVWAQGVGLDDTPLVLKSSPMLAETPPDDKDVKPPTFVFGDRISGRTDLETIIDGNAEVRRGKNAIRADRIEYYQPDDQTISRGNVRINSGGNLFNGPELQLKIDTFEGFFLSPNYRFLSNGGNGTAQRIDFIDDQRLVAREATFTTCERTDEKTWEPAWVLSGTSFKFDKESETGEATGAVLRFKNVPILAFPTISFPLSDKRKSGLLPPTFNLDSTSGFEVSQPYYFNIAPNRDATLTTTVMSKRGINLGAEARYLERDYAGRLRTNFLPSDSLRKINRWSYALEHTGTLNTGLAQV
ncbi:MAG: LPS-assembly protein LptD, partial [Polaromonas sp.]|nr:LPS-assembly protein LptD [Polaromonas sp.]